MNTGEAVVLSGILLWATGHFPEGIFALLRRMCDILCMVAAMLLLSVIYVGNRTIGYPAEHEYDPGLGDDYVP